jgi:4-amino-4-deoxy-L-arabinose transferase-like glycosyltransferase
MRLRAGAAPMSHAAALGLLCGGLFFYGLGDRDLNSSHEARAAQNAQMVLSEGDWLLPRLYDGQIELQKPPLYYWLVALVAWAGGGEVGPWAVRMPAALSAVGCVLFLYAIAIRRGRPLAGLLAALVLATCVHFTWLARVGRIDMPLTFALTVALGSFHLGWSFLGYTALGLAVLLKGPIALVLVMAVVVLRGIARKPDTSPMAEARNAESTRRLSRVLNFVFRIRFGFRTSIFGFPRSVRWGLPLMLLIAAPWFIWANFETEGRLWEVFFWYHNVERGLGGSETLRAYPWWFYGPTAALDLLPWSVALPAVAWLWLRRLDLRHDDDARLGARWFAAVFVLLSCMSFKRADYLLPAYPGFALLLGCTAERFWITGGRRVRHGMAAGFAAVSLAVMLGWMAYAGGQEDGWPHQRIAQEIRERTGRPVIFFRAEAHVLAFHVGRPVATILEWENLAWWVARPFPVYVVMPEDAADVWQRHLPGAALQEVLRSRDRVPDRREHQFVVLRTRGH